MNTFQRLESKKITPNNLINLDRKIRDYPKSIYFLFYCVAIYLVLPIIDVPLFGLSLSAPLFGVVAIRVLVRPVESWFYQQRLWINLAIMIWIGIFISAMANGLISGGVNIDSRGILTLIRYAYWLLVFVITIYFSSRGKVLFTITNILGWSLYGLTLVRWVDALVFGAIGSSRTYTYIMPQNTYGLLFSTFSPFLLILLIQYRGWKKYLVIIGNLLFLGAAAINGSRGSWVSISIGLVLCIILLIWKQPRRFIQLLIPLIILAGIFGTMLTALPDIAASVSERLRTFQNLEEDKSFAIRQLMNQKSIKLFEESPIIGVGVNRYTLSSVSLDIPDILSYGSQSYFDDKTSHNSFLSYLAENGLVGAIPFGILLLILLFQGIRMTIRFIDTSRYWGIAVFLAFVQMSMHMWANSALTNTVTWFVYGLVGSMILIGSKKTDYSEKK
jgi:O-antigen ligase